MTIKNLFGTQPSQVPRIRDLGTLAFEDAASATISGRVVSSYLTEPTVTQTSITRDIIPVTTQPFVTYNFLNESIGIDTRLIYGRASTGYRTNRFGLLQSAATNAPRYDYDPITYECKGILIENAATNLVTNSNVVDIPGSPARMTASSTTDPIGTTTAIKLTATGAAGAMYVTNSSASISLTANAVYTESIWVKPINASVTRIRYIVHPSAYVDAANRDIYFDFASLSTTFVNSLVSGTITKHSNGWYKISITFTPTNSSKQYAGYVFPANSSNETFSGTSFANGTELFSVWNCQLEIGSIHTSPIVTTGASATRAADIITIPNTYYTNNMSVYAEYSLNGVIKNVAADGANNRRHIFYVAFTSPTSLNAMFVDSTTVGYSMSQVFSTTPSMDNFATSATVPSYTATQKAAATFEYLPDTTVTTNTYVNQDMSSVSTISGSWGRGTISGFFLGSNGSVRTLNGHMKKFSLYQAKLANTQILEMTR